VSAGDTATARLAPLRSDAPRETLERDPATGRAGRGRGGAVAICKEARGGPALSRIGAGLLHPRRGASKGSGGRRPAPVAGVPVEDAVVVERLAIEENDVVALHPLVAGRATAEASVSRLKGRYRRQAVQIHDGPGCSRADASTASLQVGSGQPRSECANALAV